MDSTQATKCSCQYFTYCLPASFTHYFEDYRHEKKVCYSNIALGATTESIVVGHLLFDLTCTMEYDC